MLRLLLPSLLLLSACLAGPARQSRQPTTATVKTTAPGYDDAAGVDEAPLEDDGDDDDCAESDPGATPPPVVERPPHPLADASDAELEARLLSEPEQLGSMSLGRTNAGALYGGVPMPSSERWRIVNARETWGTQETVDFIARSIDVVNEHFPGSGKLHIGDISRRVGGHLRPHLSHQSGRDVDLGFYFTTPERWYTSAGAKNLDVPRTWALVRAFVTETDVELILVDRSIQKLLRCHAEAIGEDGGWLDQLFGGSSTKLRPLIRHAKGHKTHLHVRFYNPIAQETGRRMYRALIAHKKISPPTHYLKYRVKKGDTLGRLARKFKTSVKAIKRANRLRSSRIYAKRIYKIPQRGGVRPPSKRSLVIPARRLPPLSGQ